MASLRTLPAVALAVVALTGCTAAPEGVVPVTGFEPARYLGEWAELYRLDHSFEAGLTHVTATYERREDGKLSVVNRGWDPEACAWDTADGVARFLGDEGTASLAVSFFGPFEGGYHVFALSDAYDLAAVAGPSRDYLWILGRDPDVDPDRVQPFLDRAAALGFPVDDLIDVPHGERLCAEDG